MWSSSLETGVDTHTHTHTRSHTLTHTHTHTDSTNARDRVCCIQQDVMYRSNTYDPWESGGLEPAAVRVGSATEHQYIPKIRYTYFGG